MNAFRIAVALVAFTIPIWCLAEMRELKVYPRLTYVLEFIYRIALSLLARAMFF